MIRKPTVLILGAGSSAHCGYPLGGALVANVVQLQRQGSGIPLPECWSKEHVDSFVTRLSRSAHSSIDAFLETVPEHTDVGKYLIAYCLKQHEDVDLLFPPNNSGWYRYLFNSLLGAADVPFAGNALTIVTFNYDRSVEAYLFHALMARFDMTELDAAAALATIPIIHVHGVLGAFPEVPYASIKDASAVRTISTSINIIHEIQDTDDHFCSPAFAAAHAKISEASKVVFLGFGFHRDNVRRLRVDWASRSDREVLSTFHDTSQSEYDRLIEQLSEFGFSKTLLRNTGGYTCDNIFRHLTSLE